MAASVSLRVSTGTNAGTESSAQTGITLISADALSGGSVSPGTNSYERWVRLAVDNPGDLILTTFSFRGSPNLPDGVEIKYGVTDTPSTPVNTVSNIATHTLGTERVIFDANSYSEAGDRTRYLVFQEQVALTAPSGAITQNLLAFSWSEA